MPVILKALPLLAHRTPTHGRCYGQTSSTAAARVDLIRVMDLLPTHITSALCHTVFRRVRTSERQRAWTLQAPIQFWTAMILHAPAALSQALAKPVDQREPMFPRIVATRCRRRQEACSPTPSV